MSEDDETLRRLKRRRFDREGKSRQVQESIENEEAFNATPIAKQIDDESLILLRERPVLAVKGGAVELAFIDKVDKDLWEADLTSAAEGLKKAIASIGRIELKNHSMSWVGTGWVVDENIIVTNRHVARAFTERRGEGFAFKTTFDGRVTASLDMLQEIGNESSDLLDIVEAIHVEPDGGPDLAFFQIRANGTPLPKIELAAPDKSKIAVIGYPGFDSRIPETQHMKRIFQDTYDKKRVAPGRIMASQGDLLEHDCCTLGGNSGSPVIDLARGVAVGLHFSGTYRDRNYAVRGDVVAKILEEVKSGVRRIDEAPPERKRRARPMASAAPVSVPMATAEGTSMTVTIPVQLTISVGSPQQGAQVIVASGDDDGGDVTEARVSDYGDRGGYEPSFLVDGDGDTVTVDLPIVVGAADDVLQLPGGGNELKYEHFSVVMSKSRRLCFFSACNIDGALSKKAARVGWKYDPRLPKEAQVFNECYGNPPNKFSRGHMTRREDPGWGRTQSIATRGNEDSMHVTNACPQMQAFNSPIWLGLEDYALSNAIRDKMKICVFTGPYFEANDPRHTRVQVPRAFWKIIAFIHDDTGRLCATGYEMDQSANLPSADEAVYGEFTSKQLQITTQVPIQAIEMRSGVQFSDLVKVDPLSTFESVGGDGRVPLAAFEHIRFF